MGRTLVERLYDWALADAGGGRHLLIRRSLASGELAYYLSWSPRHAGLAELVRAAGARWAVEECFQAAKNEAALDHYQVLKHTAWYRHVTLAMCAHAWLAVTASRTVDGRPAPAGGLAGKKGTRSSIDRGSSFRHRDGVSAAHGRQRASTHWFASYPPRKLLEQA
jgi:hypothetical protein